MKNANTLLLLLAVACASPTVEPEPNDAACRGKCDDPNGPTITYEADIAAMNAEWPPPASGTPMESVEDAFRVNVGIGPQTIVADTHLFGSEVVVIPYSNSDAATDADGEPVGGGDEVIAGYFPRGEIGIAVKHHRPEFRFLNLAEADAAQMKEDFKLQDTHIEMVVGVERNGRDAAITLNNPQTYESGRFGTADYPMIFLQPAYPEYLGAYERAKFRDNIRTMMLGFNAVSNFPGDYNGGDPLATTTPEKVREHVAQMVRAIAGDQEARAWFRDPLNLVYCAELAHISFSAGLIVPLNAEHVVPLVGQETWDLFAAEVAKQDRRQPSAFTELNDNVEAQWVDVSLAPSDLRPAASYAPEGSGAENQIAFQPMTMADIVVGFMSTHIPRDVLGEGTAEIQAAVLNQMKPGLLEAMSMDQIPESDPRRIAIDELFQRIVLVVANQYEDYAAFQAALEPLLEQARRVTGPRDETGAGLFVPPSLMHLVATGRFTDGLMGLQYVGHGIHWSMVRAVEATEPDVVEPEVPAGESVLLSESGSLGLGEEVFFEVSAPAGTSRLTFTLNVPSGDADLHVRRNQEVSARSFDCRPYLPSLRSEVCEFAPPGEDTFSVMVRGFSASEFELSASAE